MKTLPSLAPQTLPHGPCFRSTNCQYAVPYHKVLCKALYSDDTLTQTKEVEVLTDQVNKIDCDCDCDPRRGCQWTKLPFLDQAVHIDYQRSLHIEAYTKLASTDQYLLSDSHKPLEHKLRVNRILLQELSENKEKTLQKGTQSSGSKAVL